VADAAEGVAKVLDRRPAVVMGLGAGLDLDGAVAADGDASVGRSEVDDP
jgi:hypothetical protein